MARLTGFQRWVIAITALVIGLRVFFPLEYGRYGRTDFNTTVLQVLGIFVLAGALLILAPSVSPGKLRRILLGGGIIAAWLANVALAAVFVRPPAVGSGVPRFYDLLENPAWSQTDWGRLTPALMALLALLWLTRLWLRTSKVWPVAAAIVLVAVVWVSGTRWQYAAGGQRVNRWTGARQAYRCEMTPEASQIYNEAIQQLRDFRAYWWEASLADKDSDLEKRAEEQVRYARSRKHPRWSVVLKVFPPILARLEEARAMPRHCAWRKTG